MRRIWRLRRRSELFQSKQFDRSLIDLLIFVSQTPDYRIPTTASILHGKLALSQSCATFDVNQACSAYPYALSIAHSMIGSGLARYALILNADTLTKLIHPKDRSLVILHGDGAAATILAPCEQAAGLGGICAWYGWFRGKAPARSGRGFPPALHTRVAHGTGG